MKYPKIWCDFNACGLSGEEYDDNFYVLDMDELSGSNPTEGMVVFAY